MPSGTCDNHLKAYDDTLAAYYQSRGTNLKTTTWTRQMAKFMAEQTRPHMKAFLEKGDSS